ncbi:hypothetical protein ACFPIJ_47035 [Dactylosporangium cerinum]|uniref:Uncharacterized protein n=1 Tax=Dactylosporangium cerinum TaxID=1434730 RepID=A0ABV9WBM2_9ACTN
MTEGDQIVSCVDVPDGTGFEALIFAWDGTLVDSREVCYQGLAQTLADVGVTLRTPPGRCLVYADAGVAAARAAGMTACNVRTGQLLYR